MIHDYGNTGTGCQAVHAPAWLQQIVLTLDRCEPWTGMNVVFPFSQESGDPGSHIPGNMGTPGPHFGGSPFSHDTGRLALGRLGDVQSDTTDNPVATVTADLGAGDCLLDCGPVLLNFGLLHDQIYGV